MEEGQTKHNRLCTIHQPKERIAAATPSPTILARKVVMGGGGGAVWGGGEGGGGGVIVVRVCEPVFQNLPHSYTWPLKNAPIHILDHPKCWPIHKLPFDFVYSFIIGC